MFATSSHFLLFLEHYKYAVIFPIVVVEGPIIMIVSGVLASLRIVNPIGVYILLVIGDTLGDVLHYYMGLWSRNSEKVRKFARFFGYDKKSERFLENHFKNHKKKTLIIGKISHGIGTPVQVAAGMAGVDVWEYTLFNFLGTLPKTLVLMLIGYYAGSSYEKFTSYLSTLAYVTVVLFAVLIVVYILAVHFAKRALEREG